MSRWTAWAVEQASVVPGVAADVDTAEPGSDCVLLPMPMYLHQIVEADIGCERLQSLGGS